MRYYIKSTILISSFTFISRILGLIRDTALASIFGAGLVLDSFILAFTLPNLFRRFFGEGALASTFIPLYNNVLEKEGKKSAYKFASNVLSYLIIFLSLIVIIGIILCLIILYFYPNLRFKTELTLKFLVVMLPYLLFICLTAFLGALLNSHYHFFTPALAPIVLNIFWIGGIFLFAPLYGDNSVYWGFALCISIVIGGIFQLLIQFLPLIKRDIKLYFYLNLNDENLKTLFKNIIPVLIGAAVVQINVLSDRLIAWLMIPHEGALTILYMANRIIQFPLAIISISLSTVVFPVFSKYISKKDYDSFKKFVPESLRISFFLTLPASVGLIALSYPIIYLIFYYKNFSLGAVNKTSEVLLIYSIGLCGYSLIQILSKAFYSLGDTLTPMKISCITVVNNIILNIILVNFFYENGLALATSINGLLHSGILLFLFNKKVKLEWKNIYKFIFKSLFISIIMGIIVFFIYHLIFMNTNKNIFIRVLSVFIPIFIGTLIYFSLSIFFKLDEIKYFLRKD